MPTQAQARKHGGVARVRTKRMPDGTLVRIYFYGDGTSTGDKAKPHRHIFDTNAERTRRKCKKCGATQRKERGRWV